MNPSHASGISHSIISLHHYNNCGYAMGSLSFGHQRIRRSRVLPDCGCGCERQFILRPSRRGFEASKDGVSHGLQFVCWVLSIHLFLCPGSRSSAVWGWLCIFGFKWIAHSSHKANLPLSRLSSNINTFALFSSSRRTWLSSLPIQGKPSLNHIVEQVDPRIPFPIQHQV